MSYLRKYSSLTQFFPLFKMEILWAGGKAQGLDDFEITLSSTVFNFYFKFFNASPYTEFLSSERRKTEFYFFKNCSVRYVYQHPNPPPLVLFLLFFRGNNDVPRFKFSPTRA